MKKKQNVIFMILLGLMMLFPARSWADVPTTVDEHLAKVKYYDDQAKAQDVIIAEHQKMKKDYENEVGFTPKWKRFYAGKIDSMKKHCNAIIRKSEQIADEFRKMAEWHRMRAKEMEEERNE